MTRSPEPGRAHSILVVEDEMVASLFLTECIKLMGHRVLDTASTGADAIVKARELAPELVIMDVGLQGDMNGVEAASAINRHAKTPILFVSAYTQDEICRYEDLPDEFHYLAKPVGAEQLQRKLDSIFDDAHWQKPI